MLHPLLLFGIKESGPVKANHKDFVGVAEIKQPNLQRRIFILAFGITFLLFSAGAAFTVFVVNPPVQQYHFHQKDAAQPEYYLPEQDEALTTLVALGEKTAPHTYLLVGFEPFRGNIPVLGLSPQTELADGYTLADCFAQQGMEGTMQALGAVLGIAIERTAQLEDGGIIGLVQDFGPVEYFLPESVRFFAMESRITLERGVHRLSGEELLAVLTYDGYTGGERMRIETAAALLTEGINQYMGMVNSLDTDGFYRLLTAHMKTTFTYEDAARHMQAARFLVRLKDRVAKPFPAEQLFREEQGRLYLQPKGLALLQEQLHTQPIVEPKGD